MGRSFRNQQPVQRYPVLDGQRGGGERGKTKFQTFALFARSCSLREVQNEMVVTAAWTAFALHYDLAASMVSGTGGPWHTLAYMVQYATAETQAGSPRQLAHGLRSSAVEAFPCNGPHLQRSRGHSRSQCPPRRRQHRRHDDRRIETTANGLTLWARYGPRCERPLVATLALHSRSSPRHSTRN